MTEIDDNFYKRAYEQLKFESRGKVSASMMYSVSRFNSWVSACGWENGDAMKKAKQETLEYFVTEYRKMLEANLDDYIDNFNDYMK